MIPPGGSGTVVAKVKTGEYQNGPLVKTVRVATSEPGVAELVLRFSMRVSAPVIVVPSGRMIVAGIEGRRAERVLLMRRGDGVRLQLGEIDNGLAEVLELTSGQVGAPADVAALGLPGGAQAGDSWLRLAVPADRPAIDREGVITVRTNHPERPRIEIPVLVRTLPVIQVIPETVRLQIGAGVGAGPAAVVRLGHNGGRPFRVLGVESWRPELVSARAVGSGQPAVIQHVRVELVGPAQVDEPGTGGPVTVRTDDPTRPEVTFTVEVVPSPT